MSEKIRDLSKTIGEIRSDIEQMQTELADMEKTGVVTPAYAYDECENLEDVRGYIASSISEAEKDINLLEIAEYEYLPDEVEYAEQKYEEEGLRVSERVDKLLEQDPTLEWSEVMQKAKNFDEPIIQKQQETDYVTGENINSNSHDLPEPKGGAWGSPEIEQDNDIDIER